MKDIVKLVLSLGLICLVGSAALTFVYTSTKEPIRQADEMALTANLKMVLPPETDKTEFISGDGDIRVYQGKDASGAIVGYAVQSVGKGGFGGDIKILAGFKPDGAIRTVMVTDSKETPGIGSKATDRKVQRSLWDVLRGKKQDVSYPPNDFLDSFNGRKTIKGGDPVHGIGGATYSSTAVIAAVDQACEALKTVLK